MGGKASFILKIRVLMAVAAKVKGQISVIITAYIAESLGLVTPYTVVV
jgi:hypothetical protein